MHSKDFIDLSIEIFSQKYYQWCVRVQLEWFIDMSDIAYERYYKNQTLVNSSSWWSGCKPSPCGEQADCSEGELNVENNGKLEPTRVNANPWEQRGKRAASCHLICHAVGQVPFITERLSHVVWAQRSPKRTGVSMCTSCQWGEQADPWRCVWAVTLPGAQLKTWKYIVSPSFLPSKYHINFSHSQLQSRIRELNHVKISPA